MTVKEEQERKVLELIEGRYASNPIFCDEISRKTGYSIRVVRAIVARLVDAGRPIYGSKRPPYGYKIMVDPDEFDIAFEEGFATIASIAKRIRRYQPFTSASEIAKRLELALYEQRTLENAKPKITPHARRPPGWKPATTPDYPVAPGGPGSDLFPDSKAKPGPPV